MPNFDTGIELTSRSRTQSVNSEEIDLLGDSDEDLEGEDEGELLLSPGTRTKNTHYTHSKSHSTLTKYANFCWFVNLKIYCSWLQVNRARVS